MKKFICGFLIGAIIFSITGICAVSYIADPASFKVLVNGEEFTSDPPALVVEGRTYLPLRAIGDALGVPVTWNEELHQAEVGTAPGKANSVVFDAQEQKNSKWKVTLTDAQSYKTIDDGSVLSYPAGEGKVYVILSFEVENISSATETFSILYASAYVDGYKTNTTLIPASIDGLNTLNGEVEAGKKMKGFLAWEVDENWKELEMSYSELFSEETEVLSFTVRSAVE